MQQVNSTLYSLNKDGSIQEWSVFTEGNEVIVQFGKQFGKIQEKVTKCSAKNVGRSNETTPEQQAILEAESKWRDQVRKGAKESPDDLKIDTTCVMLACDATKKKNVIDYGAVDAQRKLDGSRIITFKRDELPIMKSRGNKEYPQPHIIEQLKLLFDLTGLDSFDGECYLHGTPLQKIQSLLKKVQEGSGQLNYIIYDVPSVGKPWKSYRQAEKEGQVVTVFNDCRFTDLYHNVDYYVDKYKDQLPSIFVEPCIENIQDEQQAKDLIKQFKEEGYEGIILRNHKGLYEFNQRSNDLIKWKLFQDSEAVVLKSREDKNGEGVLLCKWITENNSEFELKMLEETGYRKYNKSCELIGKTVTFKFQDKTVDGKPTFAVGKSVREVDTKGNPLE